MSHLTGQDNAAFTGEDGIRYRRHGVRSKVFGYSFKDAYYPVAEDDPERFLYRALFSGILGGHRFYTGEYGKGVVYLLTCGGFGVFYAADIFNILTENYEITQVSYIENPGGCLSKRKLRIYLDKVKRGIVWKAVIFLLAAGIGFCSMRFGYMRLLVRMDRSIQTIAEEYAKEGL